jgi:hypothetical protein
MKYANKTEFILSAVREGIRSGTKSFFAPLVFMFSLVSRR